MRYIAYMIAVLAAAGIVYYVGSADSGSIAASPSEPAAVGEAAAPTDLAEGTAAAEPAGDVQLVNLKVPGMHCPAGCYPSVKEALEKEAGVQGVDLAEQKEEGLIDNPVVVIQHDADFDLDKAVASLEKVGFGGAVAVSK